MGLSWGWANTFMINHQDWGIFRQKKLTIRHTAILHTVHEAACQQAGETSWFGSLHHASAAAKKWLSPSQPHTHGLQNCRWSRLSLESDRWISTGGFAGLNSVTVADGQNFTFCTDAEIQQCLCPGLFEPFYHCCYSDKEYHQYTMHLPYSRRSPILSCSQYHRSSLSQVPLS